MTRERFEFLKEMLRERVHHAELLDSLHEERVRGDRQRFPDDSDQALSVSEDDLEVALHSINRALLKRAKDALRRLHNGTYGNCKECSKEIAEKRLSALPFAERCWQCENDHEQEEIRQRVANKKKRHGSLI